MSKCMWVGAVDEGDFLTGCGNVMHIGRDELSAKDRGFLFCCFCGERIIEPSVDLNFPLPQGLLVDGDPYCDDRCVDLTDTQGRKRGYLTLDDDQKTTLTLYPFFNIDPFVKDPEYPNWEGYFKVVIFGGGKEVRVLNGNWTQIKFYGRSDSNENSETKIVWAKNWLNENYPNWKDPVAYWD